MRKNRNSFFTESNMNYSNFQAQGAIPQAMPYAMLITILIKCNLMLVCHT